MATEKNEKPTHKKIEDARKKGQVAVSRDLAHVAALAVIGECAFLSEPLWHDAIDVLFGLAIWRVGQPFGTALPEMFAAAGTVIAIATVAVFVLCTVVSAASHWGQFGVLIEPKALEPKFDKLNPVNGFKEMFSKRKLTELLLSVAKSALIGLLIYTLARKELPSILQFAGGTPKDIYYGFLSLLHQIFRLVLGLCLLIAVIDFASQKYFHIKSLYMDMEEIEKEQKEMEGDPLIKRMRKQLAQEWATSDPPSKTQNANAVVVNPTHFAVAMFYDPATTPVPLVLAKGKDEVAARMIERARHHKIPVIRHVWLARTLYATARPDHFVPKSSYEAVAHVYAVVQELVAANDTAREVELEAHGEPPETARPA